MGQCRGARGGGLKWLSRSWLKLPSLFVCCCLEFATFDRILSTAEALVRFPVGEKASVKS